MTGVANGDFQAHQTLVVVIVEGLYMCAGRRNGKLELGHKEGVWLEEIRISLEFSFNQSPHLTTQISSAKG